MGRLSAQDDRALVDLANRLSVLDEATQPALSSLVAELRPLLRSDRVLAYGVSVEADGFALDFTYGSGFHFAREELKRLLTVGVRKTAGTPWALYDPRLPDATQRNVVLNMPPPADMAGKRGNDLFGRLGVSGAERRRLVARMEMLNEGILRRIGLSDMDVCRVLVCDGPFLLAWIGAARTERFTERECAVLRRLTPTLSRRLRTERRLNSADFHASALPVLLEAISAEAIVFDTAGRVQHANSAARALDVRELARTGHDLARAARNEKGIAGDFEITAISTPGLARHFLAVRRRPPVNPAARVNATAARWKLTKRQAEVLALLVDGRATKNIAAQLHCVDRTVEAHITRILEQAGVDNRAALIAKFWRS